MDDTNIPGHVWWDWLEKARRYEHNLKVRKAIAAIKPKKRKAATQVPLLPTMGDRPAGPTDAP